MRVLFFGDSMTYGHGLPDCVLPTETGEIVLAGPRPSELGWAATISRRLGVPHINHAVPGASNLQILWTLRQADIAKGDVVIVEWSYTDRSCLLEPEIVQIGPWMEEDTSLAYYQAHSDPDIINRNTLLIEHAALLLERIGTKWLFFANDGKGIEGPIRDTIIDCFQTYECDIADDNSHPGMVSNQIWADIVFKHVQQRLEDKEWPYGLSYIG